MNKKPREDNPYIPEADPRDLKKSRLAQIDYDMKKKKGVATDQVVQVQEEDLDKNQYFSFKSSATCDVNDI